MQQEEEPVMDIVKEADQNPKNEALNESRLRSLIERIERLEEEKKLLPEILEIFLPRQSLPDLIQRLCEPLSS